VAPSAATLEQLRIARSAKVPGGRIRRTVAVVDADVLEAFQRRDPDAVRTLYRTYGRLVYSIAHRVLGRHELAEDAVQQTFVKAWEASDRIDVDRDPTAWFATIAKRVAIDMYRRESRRQADALPTVATDDRAIVTLPPDMASLDAAWRVRQALDALPADEATVVRLQHLDGMTHAQVADKLGIPVGTVKSRSHRAHQKLAELLGHLREPLE
jgi:RNA polymerase sigma-70 factor (ECF subfamily)